MWQLCQCSGVLWGDNKNTSNLTAHLVILKPRNTAQFYNVLDSSVRRLGSRELTQSPLMQTKELDWIGDRGSLSQTSAEKQLFPRCRGCKNTAFFLRPCPKNTDQEQNIGMMLRVWRSIHFKCRRAIFGWNQITLIKLEHGGHQRMGKMSKDVEGPGFQSQL